MKVLCLALALLMSPGADMRTMETAAEFRAYLRQCETIIYDHLVEALQLSLDEVITIARGTDAFRDRTGNLRGSIGIAERIAAASRSLGLQVNLDDLVVRFQNEIIAFFGVGMEYATDVQNRTGFIDEAIAAAPEIVRRNLEQATAAAFRAIGAL